MKNTVFAKSLTLFVLILSLVGCLGGGTNTGIPPLGTYLTFADKSKSTTLATNQLIIERVDFDDSTRVIRSIVANSASRGLWSSQKYAYLFRIIESDSLVIKGWNRFRLSYSNKPDVDWLVYYTRSWEGTVPEQVKFNGKEILRQEVSEPASPSYLYVLK